MPNLKEQLLAKITKPKLFPIEFAGIPCFVKKWNEKDNIEWAIALQTAPKIEGVEGDLYTRCRAIVHNLCDESGALIFDKDDVEQVALFDASEINPVWEKIVEVQAGDKIDAKKN